MGWESLEFVGEASSKGGRLVGEAGRSSSPFFETVHHFALWHLTIGLSYLGFLYWASFEVVPYRKKVSDWLQGHLEHLGPWFLSFFWRVLIFSLAWEPISLAWFLVGCLIEARATEPEEIWRGWSEDSWQIPIVIIQSLCQNQQKHLHWGFLALLAEDFPTQRKEQGCLVQFCRGRATLFFAGACFRWRVTKAFPLGFLGSFDTSKHRTFLMMMIHYLVCLRTNET